MEDDRKTLGDNQHWNKIRKMTVGQKLPEISRSTIKASFYINVVSELSFFILNRNRTQMTSYKPTYTAITYFRNKRAHEGVRM